MSNPYQNEDFQWREGDSVAIQTWAERYPPWAIGVDEWRHAYADVPPSTLDALGWFRDKRSRSRRRWPRLFISHRQHQDDTKHATCLAGWARSCNMPVWIDIYDPMLQWLARNPTLLQRSQRSIAIALAIEMALLNCTHAVAILSVNSAGSLWIPYEFGRVKTTATSTQVTSFIARTTPSKNVPEYALLTSQLRTEQKFTSWLQAELSRFGAHGPCL